VETPLTLRAWPTAHASTFAVRRSPWMGRWLNIRKFVRGPLNMDDLVRLGSCSETAFGFLKACVIGTPNIVISGGRAAARRRCSTCCRVSARR